MKLDVRNLTNLKDSNDFEMVREILIRLKDFEHEFSNLDEYREYIGKLTYYRRLMKAEYICDVEMYNLEENKITNIINESIKRFLYFLKNNYKSINEIDTTNYCRILSEIVEVVCIENHIRARTLKIYPNYCEESVCFGNSGFHYFNILTVEDEDYLVDLSYKQFFKKNVNYLEELGLLYFCAPKAGTFMNVNEERKKVAETILKKGYIKMGEKTFKAYCDGFTISFRNGLYYEYFNNDYTTDYTAEDYDRFLIEKKIINFVMKMKNV